MTKADTERWSCLRPGGSPTGKEEALDIDGCGDVERGGGIGGETVTVGDAELVEADEPVRPNKDAKGFNLELAEASVAEEDDTGKRLVFTRGGRGGGGPEGALRGGHGSEGA